MAHSPSAEGFGFLPSVSSLDLGRPSSQTSRRPPFSRERGEIPQPPPLAAQMPARGPTRERPGFSLLPSVSSSGTDRRKWPLACRSGSRQTASPRHIRIGRRPVSLARNPQRLAQPAGLEQIGPTLAAPTGTQRRLRLEIWSCGRLSLSRISPASRNIAHRDRGIVARQRRRSKAPFPRALRACPLQR